MRTSTPGNIDHGVRPYLLPTAGPILQRVVRLHLYLLSQYVARRIAVHARIVRRQMRQDRRDASPYEAMVASASVWLVAHCLLVAVLGVSRRAIGKLPLIVVDQVW